MRSFLLFFSFLTLVLFSFTILPVCAHHIAGSDMYYKFVQKLPNGNNEYEITLIVYHDCAQLNNPGQQTGKDDNLAIYVFNNDNNNRTARFTVTRSEPPKKLDPVLVTQCAEVNYDHCVEVLTFRFKVNYPMNAKGYSVVWQRCCRNSIIKNLTNPLEVGNTFMVVLPGTENESVNNSAIFRQQPLTVICSGFSLEYDMGAVDVDGDSLEYELVPAFHSINSNGTGATNGAPLTDIVARVSGPPPYQVSGYVRGYSYIQPFGPNSNTTLNRQTGLLTINATDEGWHVVTIKVKEFRNGKLINEIYRDFQVYVSVRCKLTELPVDVSFETENIVPMANDTFLIKLDSTFCITWIIRDTSNLNTRFSYEIGGIFKDTTKFKVEQVGTIQNPLTLNVCASVDCKDLFDIYKATIKAVPINECAVKNFKEREIYFKVIPADSLLPHMKIEAPDLRKENDSIWIPLSGESCFTIKMWNSAKIKDRNEYNLFPSFPINADYWKYEKSYINDTTVFKVCLTLGCTWLEDQYLNILTRVVDQCGGTSVIEQNLYFKIDAPRFDPMLFEYIGLDKFGRKNDTLLIEGSDNVCFQAKLTTDPFSLGLKMKIQVNRLDSPNGDLSFVSINDIDSLNALIHKEMCIKALCDNRNVVLQVIFIGIDSVTCDYVRTLSDTLYFKNLNTYIRPFRLSLVPLDYLQVGDTLFIPITNTRDYCAKIILDDSLNRGSLELNYFSPLFQMRNTPKTEPLTGKIRLESFFCWKAECDNINKVYPVRVVGRSLNACKEEIYDTLDFYVKVLPEVNELLTVRWNNTNININELQAGETYCLQAVVFDPDSIDGLKSEIISEITKDGFDFDKGASVKIDGQYYQTIEVCYTPNCHSALKDHWIKICGTENTLCSGSRTVCDSIKVSIKDCFTGFPNVFTPNGDGINELFLPLDVSTIDRYQIQIFDRWGSLMYESADLIGWNGRRQNNGDTASEGVYFFTAKFRYYSGTKPIEGQRVGSFTLIR